MKRDGWLRGPALELMVQAHHQVDEKPGVIFREGDEVLLKLPPSWQQDGKSPSIGRLVIENRGAPGVVLLGLRIEVTGRNGMPFRQWQFWDYVVGWRRPNG